MNSRSALAVSLVVVGVLGAAAQVSAGQPGGSRAAASVGSAPAHAAPARAAPVSPIKRTAPRTVHSGAAGRTAAQPRPPGAKREAEALLFAAIISDKELAEDRGGTETNTNNATGTVSGNVASQLTTGSNMISQGSFSNSSGIPIVIQNTGNNVLIQNSTILNLQLTNPPQ
jgi:hypothetical protein